MCAGFDGLRIAAAPSDHTGSIGGVGYADASAVEAAPRDTLTPDDQLAEWRAVP